MGPPQKQRFNAKARQSVVGGSSHKKRRNNNKASHRDPHDEGQDAGPTQEFDANRQMIVPGSSEEELWKEKERKRRELLAAEAADPDQKLTSKKRKRLDAYIASRLKKEARAELLEELAKSSAELRDGAGRLDLGSSKTLGTGRAKTGRQLVDGSLKFGRQDQQGSNSGSDSEEEDWEKGLSQVRDPHPSKTAEEEPVAAPTGEVLDDPERRQRILDAASFFDKGTTDASVKGPSKSVGSALAAGQPSFGSFGSALAKDAQGNSVVPTIRKRKRQPLNQRQRRRLRDQPQNQSDESDSSSDFDSSDSSDDDADFDQQRKSATAAPERNLNATTGKEAEVPIRMTEDDVLDRSHDSEEDESGSGAETDSEGEAIFMEAMRLRGMPMQEYDEDDDDDVQGEEVDLDITPGEDSREASQELAVHGSDDRLVTHSGSPVWEGFGEEDDDNASRHSQSASEETSEDDQGDGDDDESNDTTEEEASSQSEEDEGDEEDDAQNEVSRRRGIQRTGRSSGFKDWARTALGFGAQDQSGADDEAGPTGRTEEGAPLQPVAGLAVKVKDIDPDDKVASGPLGEKEADIAQINPFAAKYYQEVASSKSIKNVPISRSQEVIESRLKLPVVQEEERLVRTILENEVTVICGETGSGKTTQVAQMLFERAFGTPGSDNPGLVGVTQPRRVAAVSTARRVAEELNLPSNRVSHQIRYDGTVSPQTSVKFMTDGVLLREMANDLLLSKYSVVIVDEAHERSVNTDVLIGMLSRVIKLRASRWLEGQQGARPLRLIIMSATLRVSDFVENSTLFSKPPPLLKIEARQHPVTVHFNRRTPSDYLEEAVKKASKIHTRLPPGGILIFLTGEQEIKTVCKELEQKFGRTQIEQRRKKKGRRLAASIADQDEDSVRIRVRPEREDIEAEELDLGVPDDSTENIDDDTSKEQALDEDALDTDTEDELDGEAGEIEKVAPIDEEADDVAPMHILPLYSLLSSEKQLEVFKPPPEDARLVVVATNVAETSLTIPNMKYVVDCGRAKERKYDDRSGISSFKVDWISKASAAQRAGRAGRTGPGHCYRIYSSNVFEEYFEDFAEAEIRQTPVEGLVLQMKSMNIDNVVNFPFPTAPDRAAIAKAERILTRLGALSLDGDARIRKQVARITELGRTMALFPLNPRFAKLLVQGQQHGCLPFVVALVAAMSVGELFVRDEETADLDNKDMGDSEEIEAIKQDPKLQSEAERRKDERKARRRQRFQALAKFDSLGGTGVSDAFRVLAVVGAYAYAGGSLQFCKENFLRPKAMEEVRQLRAQLSSLVISTLPVSAETSVLSANLSSPKLSPPDETQFKVLRQLIACAYIDQVAVRADLVPEAARSVPALSEMASEGRLRSRWSSCRHVPYLAMGVSSTATDNDPAYIHQTSSLFEHPPPEWCVFSEVMRSQAKKMVKPSHDGELDDADKEQAEQKGKVYLRGLTKINPSWIAKIGKDMCSFSKPVPLDDIAGNQNSSVAAAKVAARGNEKEQIVVMTPTYGTGPAVASSERVGGGIGWELPPVKAKRTWVGGLQGWKVDM
ncbi:unnamed protein product [Sympodiomycopsis kandeliae]